jgi:hypothetical protein
MASPLIAEAIGQQEAHLAMLIQDRLGGRVRDLRIVVRPSGILLQGRAATYHAKQLAQHAAMEVAGMRILANDIEVVNAPSYLMSRASAQST